MTVAFVLALMILGMMEASMTRSDDPRRWTTITAVAERLGIEQDRAEAFAAELDEQGLVRVGGGHSVTLGPNGWQLVKKRPRQRQRRV